MNKKLLLAFTDINFLRRRGVLGVASDSSKQATQTSSDAGEEFLEEEKTSLLVRSPEDSDEEEDATSSSTVLTITPQRRQQAIMGAAGISALTKDISTVFTTEQIDGILSCRGYPFTLVARQSR
jgi:hypothetical protein